MLVKLHDIFQLWSTSLQGRIKPLPFSNVLQTLRLVILELHLNLLKNTWPSTKYCSVENKRSYACPLRKAHSKPTTLPPPSQTTIIIIVILFSIHKSHFCIHQLEIYCNLFYSLFVILFICCCKTWILHPDDGISHA